MTMELVRGIASLLLTLGVMGAYAAIVYAVDRRVSSGFVGVGVILLCTMVLIVSAGALGGRLGIV